MNQAEALAALEEVAPRRSTEPSAGPIVTVPKQLEVSRISLLGVEAPERIAGREVAAKGGSARCARPPSMRNYRRRAARHEKERPRDDHPGVTERVRLATLAVRNATPNPSPSKTCPPRSASRMPRPERPGARPGLDYLMAMAPSILLSIGFFLLSHRAGAV
jgi:hypothetical protein